MYAGTDWMACSRRPWSCRGTDQKSNHTYPSLSFCSSKPDTVCLPK